MIESDQLKTAHSSRPNSKILVIMSTKYILQKKKKNQTHTYCLAKFVITILYTYELKLIDQKRVQGTETY